MLRKITALLLALLIALTCVSALAEETVVTYTHPHLGYSFDYPSYMTVLDAETIDSIIDMMVSGEFDAIDFDYASIQAQIEAFDIVNMTDMSTGNNITVLGAPLGVGIPLDAQLLASAVLPATVEAYKASLPGCEVLDEGSVCTFGDNEYARMTLTYAPFGTTLHMDMYYFDVDDTLYTVTFTFDTGETPADLLEMVLGTFAFGA